MGTVGILLFGVLLSFVALMVGMQVMAGMRARALTGKPVPPLPGALGRRVTSSKSALVYFFSPGCAACRSLTPRVQALGRKNTSVFAIDVMQSMDVARALSIMATPSTVEIAGGKVVGFHVGSVPEDVLARFA